MGGKAMASYGTVRLTRDEYYNATAKAMNLARSMGLKSPVVIPELADKASFGDIDVLYSGSTALDFGDRPYSCNGNVQSTVMLTKQGLVQVDFVRARPETYDFALAYYSFNDCGNLLGRTARYLGFSLGSTGLLYRRKDAKGQVSKVLVTNCWSEALDVIGYKPLTNSPTLAEMFEYVKSSPWFSAEPFMFENRNHKARCRDTKRATYNAFLEHLHSNRFSLPDAPPKDEARVELLEYAKDKHPAFANELLKLASAAEYDDSVRAVFNGTLVRDWAGLQGQELGLLMANLKAVWNWRGLVLDLHESYGSGGVKRWVLEVQNSRSGK